jgi:hypothetical protein
MMMMKEGGKKGILQKNEALPYTHVPVIIHR